MTGIEILIIAACCGVFNNNVAQEELAQRQLDVIQANEKRARAEQKRVDALNHALFFPPKAKKKLSWNWPEQITGLRVLYVVLGLALIPFTVEGIKCLIVTLR